LCFAVKEAMNRFKKFENTGYGNRCRYLVIVTSKEPTLLCFFEGHYGSDVRIIIFRYRMQIQEPR
jgi:hypothetical protein